MIDNNNTANTSNKYIVKFKYHSPTSHSPHFAPRFSRYKSGFQSSVVQNQLSEDPQQALPKITIIKI